MMARRAIPKDGAASADKRTKGGWGVLHEQVEVVARPHGGLWIPCRDLGTFEHHDRALVDRGHPLQEDGGSGRSERRVSLLFEDGRWKRPTLRAPMPRGDGAKAVIQEVQDGW